MRDRICTRLIGLLFEEIFSFGLVQSDPNFANYRYDPSADQIVLLDFGATRCVPDTVAANYRTLFRAAVTGEGLHDPALALGFFGPGTADYERCRGYDRRAFAPTKTGFVVQEVGHVGRI